MKLILKNKKKLPKAPKTGTMKSIDNYLKKLADVERFNSQVEHYNKGLTAKAAAMTRRVAGFGRKCK